MTNFMEMYVSVLEADYAKTWTVEYAVLESNFINARIYNDTQTKDVAISSQGFNEWLLKNNKLYLVETITTNFDDSNMPIFNPVTLEELYNTDNFEFNQLLQEFIN